MRARFNIYKIGHSGDEQTALDELTRAGCTYIKVLARDHDGNEAIRVECELPTGITHPSQLNLELFFL
jgi:hypothetical protein